MSVRSRRIQLSTGDYAVTTEALSAMRDGTHRFALLQHGIAALCTQFQAAPDDIGYPGQVARGLAEAGYFVMSVDSGGQGEVGGPRASDCLKAAGAYAFSSTGGNCKGTALANPRALMVGWSMGGYHSLLHTLLMYQGGNSYAGFQAAGVYAWAPLTDLDWFHSTSGYTAPWGGALPNNSTWITDVETSYGVAAGRMTVKNAVTASAVPASIQLNSQVGGVTANTVMPENVSSGSVSIGGVTVNFTGVTTTTSPRDTLTGCTGGASVTWAAGAAVTQAWAQARGSGTSNRNHYTNAAAFTSLGVPITVSQATDDTLLPPAMLNGWVTAVGGTGITVRTPAYTGNHGGFYATSGGGTGATVTQEVVAMANGLSSTSWASSY